MTNRVIRVFLSVAIICAVLLSSVSCGFLGIRTLSLEFTLTEEDYASFEGYARALERDASEELSYLRVLIDLNGFSDSYSFISTQATIAYVNYCKDTKNEKAIADHKFATALNYKAMELYSETLKNILILDNSVTEMLFSEWSEEEKEDLLAYNSGAEALLERNELLLVELQGLDSESEDWRELSDSLYKEFFANNKAIAGYSGYDNYYDYATEKVQLRDYSIDERIAFREYVKEYVVPLYVEIKERMTAAFDSADEALKNAYAELAYCNYDENEWETDHIADYIGGYGADLSYYLLNMYYSEGLIIGDGENALEAAFTTYLPYYSEPVAYFGNGYRDMLTVVHENGHYAAFWQPDVFSQTLDVHEIQSQGNEWMFIAYLEKVIDSELHEMLLLDRLARGLSNVIFSCAVDEAEELIYRGEAESIRGAAASVAAGYGELFSETEKLEDYVRHVAMMSPVYYISYATSELVSIGLYTIAAEDYERAKGVYEDLILDMGSYSGLSGAVDHCGLLDPFAEGTFEYIRDAFAEEDAGKSDNVTVSIPAA